MLQYNFLNNFKVELGSNVSCNILVRVEDIIGFPRR